MEEGRKEGRMDLANLVSVRKEGRYGGRKEGRTVKRDGRMDERKDGWHKVI